MHKIIIAINCFIFVLGIFTTAYGGIIVAKPISVWSDFKAFAAKVANDKQASHALSYGGESEGTNFESLLKKLWDLSEQGNTVSTIGLFITILALLAIILELKTIRDRKSN